MSTLNDLKCRALRQQGFQGSLDDMLISFYKERGVDGEYMWLANILNKTGSLNDLRYEYLILQGFTGSHNDMLLSSLSANQYFNTFTPISLFSAGEQGGWYDPSDFSTMFQDPAGTTPVTAVEQPVGLILDKSKGLVPGPELVTNGDFSNGATGWSSSTTYTSTSSVVNGVFRVNSTTNYGLQLQPISCVVGRAYVITGQARRGTVLSAAIGASANANGSAAIALATTTSNDFVALQCQFVATSTTMYVVLGGSAGNPSGYHDYDNISVRELPGNHATQTTSTSRPVLSARVNLLTKTEQFDDAVWTAPASPVGVSSNVVTAPDGSLTADRLVSSLGTGFKVKRQANIARPASSQITFSIYAKPDTSGLHLEVMYYDASVNIGAVINLESRSAITVSGVTVLVGPEDQYGFTQYSFTGFSGSGSTGTIDVRLNTTGLRDSVVAGDGTSGIYIWGASLTPANQAALPYQRVNTSTDYDTTGFPLYLKFDGIDDWLVTPTITPGVDKAQVFAGVRKLVAQDSVFIEQSSDFSANAGSFVIISSGTSIGHYFGLRGSGVGAYNSPFAAPQTSVQSVAFDIGGSTLADEIKPRVNGAIPSLTVITAGPAGTGNFLAYPLYIGRRGGTTFPYNGNLYGLIVRFGANLPAGTIASTETWLNQRTGAY